ncbi:phytase [Pholiota conissans]|uniref:Phytase A n=1 Tax=Pholiota conissans TaxID=109636 RepID=A0A9P5YZA8_9AGAR|nr:phytase [Pholiota conissans]
MSKGEIRLLQNPSDFARELSVLPQDLPIQHSWGAYTPYFSAEPYTPPPDGCHITQVNIIQRHGARVPTFGSSLGIVAAVEKLQEATNYTATELNFLSNYTYTLAMNGDLLPFGAIQSEESGYETYKRYANLVSHEYQPFIRAASGVRVVDSANNWTLGFSIASNKVYTPSVSVILSESSNCTLDDTMCPNVGSSDDMTALWASIYAAPIAARLNAQAPGANLRPDNIPFLMALCAFETIANGRQSPFCTLFTPQEFAQYEYFVDVGKYYGTGHGAYLGRVQGVGYVNELLARLTGKPVNDKTQTNSTLDSSPITFPLNHTLYADFSHDNQMVAIYSAIGLFKQPADLDPTLPDPKRTWYISQLTPFSGRMVTERLTCPGRVVRHGSSRSLSTHSVSDTFVRILVNDALQLLEFCGGDKDGLCTLDAFVESQAYSRENGQGDFEKCFD